ELPCFCTAHAPPARHTLSLHDALPIYPAHQCVHIFRRNAPAAAPGIKIAVAAFCQAIGDMKIKTEGHGKRSFWGSCHKVIIKDRSEEHTSELQSRFDIVCRLLLEKKKQ